MGILNYSTKIDVVKTMFEIAEILAKAGARSITIDYDGANLPTALTFSIRTGEDAWLNFRLPANYDGVFSVMVKEPGIPASFKTHEQSRRVAWRIIKDWCAAQMALVEARQAELSEVFLPYAVSGDGRTFYKVLTDNNFGQLGGGTP